MTALDLLDSLVSRDISLGQFVNEAESLSKEEFERLHKVLRALLAEAPKRN